ncbi:N-acetylmuramoyl-L-alanine amidase [Halopseudomonas pelagia]|uniref:N-acetylmuramoyl-L-alanine amidase n=1 Tax=Halopseudomonas pelagia TaxID=553151 RepID=A0AA91U484_9GAMM|nr:N-acetylmuramoyl-L-alanine amidase [Halopseudomonas pelagia]PCD00401.1 N-acetylmuramoyl-L-alanine amidase [Halopseudomonas pelagia]QFY55104.1 N-acetylmuramoyl-L-alanine amidase [Halopseudomonas pelagia]
MPLRLLPLVYLLLWLTGCTSGLKIDTRYNSPNHDSRVQYVVLHYTSSGFERSLNHLLAGEVSSHYLIGATPPIIYRLVDENRRAWHAGDSSWQGRTWLNSTSIGIEIVHPGYTDTPAGRVWHPWPQDQIDALIPLLKDILQRHGLGPDRVVGHSDIAPQRKVDPGPLFPWRQLADAGVAIWPEQQKVEHYQRQLGGQTPPVQWFEMALEQFGYNLARAPEQVNASKNLLAAFQMRFRPARFDGVADAETAAILAALVPQTVNSPLWCKPAAQSMTPAAPSVLRPCAQPYR